MGSIKKIFVFAPVLVVGIIFLRVQYFRHHQPTNANRLVLMMLAMLVFYAWVCAGIIHRKQNGFQDLVIQASFYVYCFCVLTLTGYFSLFNQLSGHGWWQKMVRRVQSSEGVNLHPLSFIKAHHLFSYEVVGNFIMLLPLGIYLPLLYKNLKGFLPVTFVALLSSVSIELMQLATSVRITDVDDVILNTTGASVGYIGFIFCMFIIRRLYATHRVQLFS
jgi:glycopeptide antibiotics resistance protein